MNNVHLKGWLNIQQKDRFEHTTKSKDEKGRWFRNLSEKETRATDLEPALLKTEAVPKREIRAPSARKPRFTMKKTIMQEDYSDAYVLKVRLHTLVFEVSNTGRVQKVLKFRKLIFAANFRARWLRNRV